MFNELTFIYKEMTILYIVYLSLVVVASGTEMQLYSVRLCKEKGPDYRGFVQVIHMWLTN